MGNEVQWEDAPAAKWEDAPEDESTLHKAGKLLDRAFHNTMGITGPISEAASNMLTGVPAALGGGLNYLGTLGATQDPNAALAVKQGTEKAIGDKTQYESHSELGKKATDLMNNTFQKIVEEGGPAFTNTVKSIPVVGKDLASNTDATDAIGRATTEMMLNVDPLIGIKALHGARAEVPALKIEDPQARVEPKWEDAPKQVGAADRGVAPSAEAPQGQLFGEPAAPTAPIPENAQGDLFNGMPTNYGDPTNAHADDFAAVNPYDVGGHVSEAQAGRPATIDSAQPDMLGGKILEPAQPHPEVDAGWRMAMPENTYEKGDVGSRDAAHAKLKDMAQEELNALKEGRLKDWQTEEAHAAVAPNKDVDFNKMEAQRELDFADSAEKIQNSPTRSFFLDPRNMDKVDFHSDHDFAHSELGDTSMMEPEHSTAMAEHLAAGRPAEALGIIARNHERLSYRKLASYLMDKLDGINVRVHDEGILDVGERQATGYYDPTTRTVGFSKVGAVSPHTVLHELVHAVTSDFINSRPNDLRVMGIKDLFNKLNELGMQKEFPSIVNPKEFLAEAFSNPEFQKYLKDHRVANRSTWARFVDNVKSILGFSSATRNDITNALEHTMDLAQQIIEDQGKANTMQQFKDAGIPSKLSDLMVSRQPERPNQVVRNENMKGVAKIGTQFDFTPLKPEEVIPMARTAADIPAGTIETIKANLDAGGRFASLRHNNNPVVKYTFAYVDHAVKQYEKWIRDNITDAKTGIKAMLQRLPSDDFTAVHAQLMLDEGQRERTPQQMRELGWSEKMVEAAQRLRQVDKEQLARFNEARARMNPPLPPIEARIGHLAGRFLGDFYHTVYELNPDGTRKKAVMMLTGTTEWGAQKLADHMAKEHPEWEISKQEYKPIKKTQNSDRFSGFMELMNFIGNKDPEVRKALDSLDKYNRNAVTNYLNVRRHAMEKKVQPGGIVGSEGHKAWVDAKTNAEEGFKAHLAYLDTTAKWIEMQKAMENISKVTTDREVTQQQPNAIKWSTAYTDHALHRNQGFLTEFSNSLLSEVGRVTGVGHTNITKGINWMSTAIMRNWMGIGNIPFAIKHLALPLQKMPAMLAYLKTHGEIEQSVMMAGVKSLSSYYHYLKGEPTSAFEKQSFQYAKDNNVFGVTLDNLSGRIQSGKMRQFLGKVADADFSGPEHAIRGTAFFTYAHLLHDAGMEMNSAFSAAEHMTKFLYTDYAPHEAPRITAKGGFIGQLATQISRYKTNEYGQLTFFNRERMKGEDVAFMDKMTSNLPLMTHVASLLAFTGATGMIGYNAADNIYSMFRKYVMGEPDNLTAVLQRSKAPDLVKFGMSSLIGLDSKISEADLLPSPFPTTRAEIELMGTAFNAARYHDLFHMQQLALGLTPSTFRGPMENAMFTGPQETQGPHAGKSLYLNPNTGEGRVWRTPEQQQARNFGFHTIEETDETENSYAMRRIEGDNRDLAEHVLDKAKGLMASNALTPQAAQELARQYAQHQQVGQPSFASALTAYAQSRHVSQREQMELKAARDHMGNSLTVMQRNK